MWNMYFVIMNMEYEFCYIHWLWNVNFVTGDGIYFSLIEFDFHYDRVYITYKKVWTVKFRTLIFGQKFKENKFFKFDADFTRNMAK